MTTSLRQGSRIYSHKMDLFGHVTDAEGIGSGYIYIKWEPPYDQGAASERIAIDEYRIELAQEFDPRLDQKIDEPIEAPASEIEPWQKEAMAADPFPAKQVLSEGGYYVHDVYDAAAENDLGAALLSLINRALENSDQYLVDNAKHVQTLMGMALEQQTMIAK